MLGLYQKALDETGRIVAAVRADQLPSPTPCSEWDVRALLGHIIGSTEMFAAGGLAPGAAFEPAVIGTDFQCAYHDAANRALETLSAPGAMQQTFKLPPGELPGNVVLGIALTEAVVHGWDLAMATNQPALIDNEIAEAILGFYRQITTPEFRAGPQPFFATEVPVSSNATPGDRLVAFLGRRP